jgi:hypothetical protein
VYVGIFPVGCKNEFNLEGKIPKKYKNLP